MGSVAPATGPEPVRRNPALLSANHRGDDAHTCTPVCPALLRRAETTRGFMPDEEGLALHRLAHRAVRSRSAATLVEIGAWCGRSTLYLGSAVAADPAAGAALFSVDHHHGSEENQAGWEHHQADLVDARTGRIDTLPWWRQTVDDAAIDHCVIGVVGDSPTVARHWQAPIDLCFIDGGHGDTPARADYASWAPLVALGGWLAIHDVFPNPADGGRPPYKIWQAARASGQWAEDGACGSLRVLRRIAQPDPRVGDAGPSGAGLSERMPT